MRNSREIRVLPDALKHGLSETDVIHAWNNAVEYRRTRSEKQPPHYLAIGALPNGETAELVGFSTGFEWFVFHAKDGVTPGFLHQWKEAGK